MVHKILFLPQHKQIELSLFIFIHKLVDLNLLFGVPNAIYNESERYLCSSHCNLGNLVDLQ